MYENSLTEEKVISEYTVTLILKKEKEEYFYMISVQFYEFN